MNISPKTLIPWLAALIVLLVAWFVPLPGQVLGKDQQAQGKMPGTRAAVETTRRAFLEAEKSYLDYVKQTDMTHLLFVIKSQIAIVRERGGDTASVGALYGVLPYLERVQHYATTGEAYYRALKQYDDDMMAWTRSLGSVSTTMREDTFALADHVRIYPAPIGEVLDPPYMSPAQVDAQAAAFKSSMDRFGKVQSVEESRQVVEEVNKEVDGVWEVGRVIQRFEGLHEAYYGYLQVYDKTLQGKAADVARGAAAGPTPIALALNLLVGALALLGIGSLFISGWQRKVEGQVAAG